MEVRFCDFVQLFQFNPELAFHIGVEREAFLTDPAGKIAPLAQEVLRHLPDAKRFGYELSACQIEERIGPCKPDDVREALLENELLLANLETRVGFGRLWQEVAPADIPLDVYPDPTGRYAQIARAMPLEKLAAACRVTGTHIHIGMPDHETALRVHNGIVAHVDDLVQMGDASRGERMRLYSVVEPDWRPLRHPDWWRFYEHARRRGFAANPRDCWSIVRLSRHGTIEFRMFGSTPDIDAIASVWVPECLRLCQFYAQRGR